MFVLRRRSQLPDNEDYHVVGAKSTNGVLISISDLYALCKDGESFALVFKATPRVTRQSEAPKPKKDDIVKQPKQNPQSEQPKRPQPETPAAGVSSSLTTPYPIIPIGYMESCFTRKNGTPRQGALVPGSIGRLRVLPNPLEKSLGMLGAHAIEGLGAYSHVWIVFWFHDNGGSQSSSSSDSSIKKAKVYPPRMNGGSVGMYATRTPHRVNPMGLTLAKLERIEDSHTLVFSGIDLVNGFGVVSEFGQGYR
jgi:tRNA (Thr-GGU) A37 N-methylase